MAICAQTVCATGCDYTSIAEATNDSPGGSTILVRQGVYNETGIRLGGQFAHRIISEAPNEPGKVVIDGGGGEVFEDWLTGATLIGVTVRNSEASRIGGAVLAGGTATIENAVFEGNFSTQGGGAVACTGSAVLSIRNTLFRNNSAEGFGGAITAGNCGGLIVQNSIFIDNVGENGGAISVTSAPSVIENSQFFGNRTTSINTTGGAIRLSGTVNHRLSQLLLSGNRAGGSGTGAARGGGIGITTSGPAVTMNGITLIGNEARSNDNDRFGGGLHIGSTGGAIDLQGVTAIQNTAVVGGGIRCDNPNRIASFGASAAGNTPDQISNCSLGCTPGQARSCTLPGTGSCSMGTQICQADGSYGVCGRTSNTLGLPGFTEGETQCKDGQDNDCDGAVDTADQDCDSVGTRTRANAEESLNVSDPVNTLFGELWQRFDADLDLGGPLPLRFARYYASGLDAAGIESALGTNWRHNFDWSASIVPGVSVDILSAEGRLIEFQADGPDWQLVGNQDVAFQLVSDAGELVLGDPRTRLLYAFNATSGRLNTIQDGNLNTLSLSYSGGNLSSVNDGLGRSLTLAYNSGLLLSVSDDSGRQVVFGHSGNDLTTVTDVRSFTTVHGYAPGGLMTTMTRPRGNTPYSQSWDGMDRVATQTDANANQTSLGYDTPSLGDTTISDPLAQTAVHSYRPSGVLINLRDEAGQDIAVGNDAAGRRAVVLDRRGDYSQISYDSDAEEPGVITRADGSTRRYGYSSITVRGIRFNLPSSELQPSGGIELYSYDGAGNLTRITDAEGNATLLSYDTRGLPTIIVNPLGASTQFSYNPDGTLASRSDGSLNMTSYAYDARRRPILISFADGSSRSLSWDLADNLLSVTDGRGNTTSYSWDANGLLASRTDRENQTTLYSYDDLDRLASITDAGGGVSTVAYVTHGRVQSLTDPGLDSTSFAYDARGRLVAITHPDASTVGFAHDDEGALTAVTNPLAQTTTLQVDALSRTNSRSSPLGLVTAFDYDPLLRQMRSTSPGGRVTTTAFDLRGRLSQRSVDTLLSQWQRDELGRVQTLTTPSGSEWSASFDAAGRLIGRSDPLGNTSTISYDARNRPEVVSFPGGLGSVEYDYDANGNRIQASYTDGTTLVASFDAENRLIGGTGLSLSRDANGRIVTINGLTLTRDAQGRVSSYQFAPGRSLNYGYDARDRVISVSDWLGNTTTISYNAAGRISGIQRPNGVDTVYQYDADGRLSRLTHAPVSPRPGESPGPSGTPTPLVDVQINDRLPDGRILDLTRIQPTLADLLQQPNFNHAFDAADRIVGQTHNTRGEVLDDGIVQFDWGLDGALNALTGPSFGTITLNTDHWQRPILLVDGMGTREYVWGPQLSPEEAGLQISGGVDRRALFADHGVAIERRDGQDQAYHDPNPFGLSFRRTDGTELEAIYRLGDERGRIVAVTDADGEVIESSAWSELGLRLGFNGLYPELSSGQTLANDQIRVAAEILFGDDGVIDSTDGQIKSARPLTGDPAAPRGPVPTQSSEIDPLLILPSDIFNEMGTPADEPVVVVADDGEGATAAPVIPPAPAPAASACPSAATPEKLLLSKRRELLNSIGRLQGRIDQLKAAGNVALLDSLLRTEAIASAFLPVQFSGYTFDEVLALYGPLAEAGVDELNKALRELRSLSEALQELDEELDYLRNSIVPELTPYVTIC